jgi:hypothetical protein
MMYPKTRNRRINLDFQAQRRTLPEMASASNWPKRLQHPRSFLDRLLGRDPSEARELVARPGELSLGVMAGVELRA